MYPFKRDQVSLKRCSDSEERNEKQTRQNLVNHICIGDKR